MKHNWAFWLCTVDFIDSESKAFLSYCSILNDFNYIGDLRALNENSHFAAKHGAVWTLFAEAVYGFLTTFLSSNSLGRSEPFFILPCKNNRFLITFMKWFQNDWNAYISLFRMMSSRNVTSDYFVNNRKNLLAKAPIWDFKRTYEK